MKQLTEQLDLFQNNLKNKPYCTNDFAEGLYTRRKETALGKRYIQHNHDNEKMWLVYDIDRAMNPLDIENDLLLPPCNLFIQNPENSHAHVAYSLEVPIHVNSSSSQRVLRYASAIDCAYQEKLQADRGYAGLVMKNPLNSHWFTSQHMPHSYDLGELASYVDLKKWNDKRVKLDYGLGRNVTLFNKLRFWAYRMVNDYRPHNLVGWENAVFDKCEEFNCGFDASLPYSEVKATAKSVAKWVWKFYTPKINRGRDAEKTGLLDLEDKLTYSAIATNKARKETTQAKINSAVAKLLKEKKKVTQKAVVELSGLHRNTVSKYKDLLK